MMYLGGGSIRHIFHFRARGNFYSFLVGTACMHTSRIIAAVCISVLQLVLSHSKASLKLSKKRSSILLYRSHENEPFHLLSGHPDSVSKKRKKSDSVTVSFFNEIFTACLNDKTEHNLSPSERKIYYQLSPLMISNEADSDAFRNKESITWARRCTVTAKFSS